MQYNKGDNVVYGNYGVCEIRDIRLMSFSSERMKEKYYVLSPLGSKSSTYYIPVSASPEVLRLPLTKEEIDALLEKAKSIHFDWQENRQLRADRFHSVISKGISEELIALIECLYKRKQELQKNNKTLSSSDDSLFSSAEKLLTDEFSFSLEISKDEVSSYISDFFKD